MSLVGVSVQQSSSPVAIYFNVDPVTGNLSLLFPYDRVGNERISLTILAVDSGVPSLTGTINVHIDVSIF